MTTRAISLILIAVGIAYMVVDGWLMSWSYVPYYRSSGPAASPGNDLYANTAFFTFWALSIPFGAVITALGLAVYARIERARVVVFVVFATVFLLWLGLWTHSILYSAIYGVGGGVILFSFCIAVISLTKARIMSRSPTKSMFDLRMIGYLFLLITAWGLCGLLGIPAFGLRPERVIEYETQGSLQTMGVKVLVSFTLGWIFLALSQLLEYRSIRNTLVS